MIGKEGMAEYSTADFLSAGQTCKATFWPTPSLKGNQAKESPVALSEMETVF